MIDIYNGGSNELVIYNKWIGHSKYVEYVERVEERENRVRNKSSFSYLFIFFFVEFGRVLKR